MASSKEYRDFILDQLSSLDEIRTRPMMGEYLLYCGGVLVGGIYDNRLLLKPSPSILIRLPDAVMQHPYDGAKPMVLIEDVDDRESLAELITAAADDLSE